MNGFSQKKIYIIGYNLTIFIVGLLVLQHFAVVRYHSYDLDKLEKIPHEIQSSEGFNDLFLKVGFFGELDKKSSFTKNKISKTPGVIRVGCFGDSHTYGSEVDIKNDYPSLLQKLLGPQYEVLNFGVSGYSYGQEYLMIKYFSKLYDLDIILLGPAGIHEERMLSFNFWNDKNVSLTSRFILQDGQLLEVSPHHLKPKLQMNYFSLVPDLRYWKYERKAISFLKAFSNLFGADLGNPFYYSSDSYRVEGRKIQFMLAEEIAKMNKRVIHLVNSTTKDFYEGVQGIEGYGAFLIKNRLESFPYRSPGTHGSVFENLLVARKMKQLILMRPQVDEKFNIIDSNKYLTAMKSEETLKKPKNLKVIINGVKVGELGGFRKRSLKKEDERNHFDISDKLLVGYYGQGMEKANAMFFLTEKREKNIFFPKPDKVEYLQGKSNVVFVKYDDLGVEWYHPRLNIHALTNKQKISVNGETLMTATGPYSSFIPLTQNIYRVHLYPDVDLDQFMESKDLNYIFE